MLQEVHLPLGLVQQASQPDRAVNGSNAGSNTGRNSSSSKLLVGSRVLVLPRGSWLWQPGEVTAVQQQDAQQCTTPAGGSNTGSSGGSSYTVQLVGQQRILTVGQDCIVSVEAAAALTDTQLESNEAADIAATAATAVTAVTAATAAAVAMGGSSRAPSGSTGLAVGSGSDMSFSSEEGGSGGETDDEASSEMEERHLGGMGDVLDHARCAVHRIIEVVQQDH